MYYMQQSSVWMSIQPDAIIFIIESKADNTISNSEIVQSSYLENKPILKDQNKNGGDIVIAVNDR